MQIHSLFMRRCLALATIGRGKVGNGAMVGAVLARNGTIIAEGWHDHFGGAHAERMLLENFDQIIDSQDVLYVSLEPCCHTGKTPPCTDIILKRGVKHVVFGLRDPDIRVAGKGIDQLRKSGITVIGPVLEDECRRFNRGFLSVRLNNRPWITLKKALSLDGSFANLDGSPKKITDISQDAWAHAFLRARSDAILVGIQTIINDNPRLDCRLSKSLEMNKNIDQYQPWRIILDPHLRIPLNARVVDDDSRERTMIVHCAASKEADHSKAERLKGSGVRVLSVDMRDGMFDWNHLWRLLTTPDDDYCGLTSILVEGGRRTWELFANAGVVDEEVILMGK